MAVTVLGTQARDEVVAMRVRSGRGGRGSQQGMGLGAALWGWGSPSGRGIPGSFCQEAGLMGWETDNKQPNTLKKISLGVIGKIKRQSKRVMGHGVESHFSLRYERRWHLG